MSLISLYSFTKPSFAGRGLCDYFLHSPGLHRPVRQPELHHQHEVAEGEGEGEEGEVELEQQQPIIFTDNRACGRAQFGPGLVFGGWR